MKKSNCLFLVVGMFVAGLFAIAIFGEVASPNKTTGAIEMYDTCDNWLCRLMNDEAYTAQEINVPNSQANDNNAKAAVNFAQATQVVTESEQYTETVISVSALTTMFLMLGIAGVGVFIFWIRSKVAV